MWLRKPWWDLTCLAFCWVPFYLWVVFGLGIGAESFGWAALKGGEARSALALATVVALGVTFVHRQYTFVLVYGDKQTFASRARAFVAAPVIVIVIVFAARYGRGIDLFAAGKLRVTPWLVLLTVSGIWNVWHTVQQRYGILRVYAGRSGRGLQEREHARRDKAILWAAIGAVAAVLLLFRQSTFGGHANARRVLRTLRPFTEHAATGALLGAIIIGAIVVAVWWLRHEKKAPIPWRERIPRLSFLGSTLVLLAVFIVHGPIVGYLCFGTAHALEYLAFVHHFGERKFARPGSAGPVASLMRRPLIFAPILIGSLALLYTVLRGYHRTDVYLGLYFGSTFLHFLYDGWIWKVRRPEVGRPLGVKS